MFFTPIFKSDWFYVHKASQCLMVILIVAMLVMPILHQPQKAEAVVFSTVVIAGLFVIGAAVIGGIFILIDDDDETDPCENCDAQVTSPGSTHKTTCANCGTGVWTLCRDTTQHPHIDICECDDSYYTCVSLPGSTEETENDHKFIDSDCGWHRHRICQPSNNHVRIDSDEFFLCSHAVYECTEDGHTDAFCDECQLYYPNCQEHNHTYCEECEIYYPDGENHVCPPSMGDASSGCCSSGCCSAIG